MKKFIFSLFFFSLMAAGLQAQKSSCAKSCSKSAATAAACQSKSPAAASVETTNAAAAKLASMDASIEAKKCPVTGNVSYVQKVSSKKGEVSYVDVTYDASTNSFVNVAPSKTEAAGMGAGCSSAKGASAKGKACCASGASASKSCCASKAGVKTAAAEKVKS